MTNKDIGLWNSCSSYLTRTGTTWFGFSGSRPHGLHNHDHNNYKGCLTKCFLGVQPDRAFGKAGDSGALVFDGERMAIGVFCAYSTFGTAYVTPPDISHVIPLEDVFEDMKGMGLTNIKFANDI